MGEKEKEQSQKPISLLKLVTLGVTSSILVVGGLFLLFAAYESRTWLFWTAEEHLDPDTLFGVGRNAVTLAAALGVGVTLFFSYRKQQTAENAQELAVKAQNMAIDSQKLATETLQLSLDKHELERISELRNRYARCAEQLASEKNAIQLAGIHSLASLADDWIKIGNEDDQQVCIALLSSYVSGTKVDPKDMNPTPESAAVEILSSRLQADLLGSYKSWSSKSINLTAAPMSGWNTPTITGGRHSFVKCYWVSTTPRSFNLEGGRLRISGNLSDGTYPLSVHGVFSSGVAFLTVTADAPQNARFSAVRFTGSNVTIRTAIDSKIRLSFSSCEFTAGRVSISRPRDFLAIYFVGCRFSSRDVIRLVGGIGITKISLEECTIMDTMGERPYSTDEFLADLGRPRPVDKGATD